MNARFRSAGGRAAASGALGIAGLVALMPTMAHATAPSRPAVRALAAAGELPPVGERDTEPLASDFVFTIGGQTCRAHVTGSVEDDITGQDAAHGTDTVTEKDLRLRGTDTCGNPDGQTRADSPGSITIEQNDLDVDGTSLLRLTQNFPPKYEQVMVLSFTMVIDQPEGAASRAGRAYEPLVLTTKDPAKLVGTLTQFPPRGDIYQLQNPVDLIDLDDPGVTVATIQKFPVKVGGL